MDEEKRTYEPIKFTFTADELRELGQQLAHENQEVYNLERKKKLDNAESASLIKAANDKAETTTIRINNGYEMREVEVKTLPDVPSVGKKSIVRCDTDQVIRVETMTLEEMQHSFDFKKLMQAEDDRDER